MCRLLISIKDLHGTRGVTPIRPGWPLARDPEGLGTPKGPLERASVYMWRSISILARGLLPLCYATCSVLKCLNENRSSGRYFHLKCLGYKKRPNNYKTNWLCDVHIISKEQRNTKVDDDQDSLSFTHVSFDADIDRHKCLTVLNNERFNIIEDITGWLDCDIIDQAQRLIKKVNPNIYSLQRPSLGPVKNFQIVTGDFIQILHTCSSNWVCVNSIGCQLGVVNLFDSMIKN